MQAVTVVPGTAGSARLDDVPEPGAELGSVVVEALAVGVCGTDAEIAGGGYGWAPPGEERLILGHESLGRVVDPGPPGWRSESTSWASCGGRTRCRARTARWASGTCAPTAATPSAASSRSHGFMAERWRIEPEYVVRVDKSLGVLGVLLEPTTVVAKAWEQILTIGQRTFWDPHTVLVVGAGPIGLLAALIGVQRGLRGPRARPGHDRSEAGAGRGSWAPPTTPGRWPTWG